MKLNYSIAFCFLFSVFAAKAQMHERGKKNFFLEPEGSVNFANHKSNAFTGNKFGMAYGMSAGKIFAGFIKTGLVYRYNQNVIGNFDSSEVRYTNFQHQSIGIKADLMIPFLHFNLGKSNKYECMGITNYLLLGPEFDYNFGAKNLAYSIKPTTFLLNVSYAMLFKKSGSKKKQAANDIYVSINMKKGLSNFAKYSIDSQKFYSTYWGISIIWIHYKTGNWLG